MHSPPDAYAAAPLVPRQHAEAIASPPPRLEFPAGALSADGASVRVQVGTAEAHDITAATGMPTVETAAALVTQLVGLEKHPREPAARAASLERASNDALAVLHSMAPRDALEGMLGAQLVALHGLAMGTLQQAQGAETPERRERLVRQATRLTGAFAAHADALHRRRNGGTQRVVVERVEVQAGGQAVVGAVAAPRGRGGT